jgi:hypothetical protein
MDNAMHNCVASDEKAISEHSNLFLILKPIVIP